MASGFDVMNTILAQEEKRLSTELANIRANYEHAGIKGTKVERVLRDLLRLCLPTDLRVGHGEVFDLDGRQSRQTDVVIANQYHFPQPPDHNWEEPQKFMIECVECAGEVKSALTSRRTVEECFENARSFKSLLGYASSSFGQTMGGDKSRFLSRRPYFVFAFESKLRDETVWERLTELNSACREIDRPIVDAVFILNRGTLLYVREKGAGRISVTGTEGARLPGYVGIGQNVITRFLFWTFVVMPRLIYLTHPATNYLAPQDPGENRLTELGDVKRVKALDVLVMESEIANTFVAIGISRYMVGYGSCIRGAVESLLRSYRAEMEIGYTSKETPTPEVYVDAFRSAAGIGGIGDSLIRDIRMVVDESDVGGLRVYEA